MSDHWLRLPSNTRIAGDGAGSVLKFTWKYNDGRHDGYYLGNRDQNLGNKNISLSDFAVEGAGDGLPSGPNSTAPKPFVPGIRMRLVRGLTITGLEVRKAVGISVLVQGSRRVKITRNYIHHSGRDGINIGWYGRDSRRVLVRHNTIRRVGDDGVAVIGGPPTSDNNKRAKVDVRQNRIIGWEKNPNGKMLGRGIAVLGARGVKVRGNDILRTHEYGILVSGSLRQSTPEYGFVPPWRTHHVKVSRNLVREAGTLSEGSTLGTRITGVHGVTLKRGKTVKVKRNTVERPLGKRFYYSSCPTCGPQR